MTKESQDARGGTWPPPAVFEIPQPVDLLASALEFVHKDDLQAALGALQKAQILKRPHLVTYYRKSNRALTFENFRKAARAAPDSYEGRNSKKSVP